MGDHHRGGVIRSWRLRCGESYLEGREEEEVEMDGSSEEKDQGYYDIEN